MARVLFVSKPLVPPWNDSSKNLVRDLALGLERHEAVAFGRRDAATELGGARLEPLHPSTAGGFSPALRENARVLARLLVGRRGDLWHFFFAPNPKTSQAARWLTRLRRVPSVQTVCSVPRADAALEQVLFGDRIVVLSEHTERRFLAAGIARERLVRIPPAVATLPLPDPAVSAALRAELGVPGDGTLLVYPGDLEFGGGARLVVDAHAELPAHVTLVVACRAKTAAARAHEDALRERTRELGTAPRVRFVGETTRILELLGAADVVALPSDIAYAKMDYPLVLLEAMALARPVVVAEDTPAAELAQGGAARAVPATTAGVTQALAELCGNAELCRAEGAAARRAALERFDRTRMAGAYELLYDELLS